MRKIRVFTTLFGIIMTVLWSVLFAYILKSWIGILVGLGFGAAFMIAQSIMMHGTENDKKDEDRKDR